MVKDNIENLSVKRKPGRPRKERPIVINDTTNIKRGRGRPKGPPKEKVVKEPKPKLSPEQLAENRKIHNKKCNDKLKNEGYFKRYNQEKINGHTIECPTCYTYVNKAKFKRHEKSKMHQRNLRRGADYLI